MTARDEKIPPADKTREEMWARLSPEKKDFIGKVRAGRKDPVYFCNELLGVPLHDEQRLWLWMTTKRRREEAFELGVRLGKWPDRAAFDEMMRKNPDFLKNILVPSNRWGKTFVTSVKHIWYNFYKIGARGKPEDLALLRCGTLNLSPHSLQVDAGYQYVLDILGGTFIFTIKGESQKNKCLIKDFLVGQEKQKRKINFKNGTSYRGVPTGEDQASSLAGTPYLYISYDECAQSMHLKSELPAKVMSRLIDFGGPLDLVSTPEVDKPSHQYYFHIVKLGLKGTDGWWTLAGKITDNIFLGVEEVKKATESIKQTDPAKYRQVAFGDFITTGKKMFDHLVVERIWDSFDMPLPLVDHKYLVSVDWGFSDTGDPTVFYVLDYTNSPRYRIVYRESIRGGSPFAVFAQAKTLVRYWNEARFVHDASALGGVIVKKILREMDLVDMIDFTSGGGNKSEMLFLTLVVLTEGRVVELDEEKRVIDKKPDFGRLRSYYIPELEEQMGNYQYNPGQGISDKKIEQDDIMALGMGLWYLEQKSRKTDIKQIDFNPLAGAVGNIFNEKSAQVLKIKQMVIPEKRIF